MWAATAAEQSAGWQSGEMAASGGSAAIESRYQSTVLYQALLETYRQKFAFRTEQQQQQQQQQGGLLLAAGSGAEEPFTSSALDLDSDHDLQSALDGLGDEVAHQAVQCVQSVKHVLMQEMQQEPLQEMQQEQLQEMRQEEEQQQQQQGHFVHGVGLAHVSFGVSVADPGARPIDPSTF